MGIVNFGSSNISQKAFTLNKNIKMCDKKEASVSFDQITKKLSAGDTSVLPKLKDLGIPYTYTPTTEGYRIVIRNNGKNYSINYIRKK